MAEFIYLVRNAELYNIGRTDNLELTKKQFAPGILEAVFETNDSTTTLKILHNKYANARLPQSNYFRLTKEQFNECKLQMKQGRKKEDFNPFFSGLNLFSTFIIAWISLSLIIIKFAIQPILNQIT